jgi:hypothetical protein
LGVTQRSSLFVSIFVVSAIGSLQSTQAQELERWQCIVEDFKGFSDDDQQFIEDNLRKKFVLLTTETEIFVQMSSKDFEGGEDRYRVFSIGSMERHAMRESTISLDTLTLPLNIPKRIASEGYFNAVLTTQSDFYANSWLLRCVE